MVHSGIPDASNTKYTCCKSTMSVDFIIYTVDYGLKIETIKIHMSNYAK